MNNLPYSLNKKNDEESYGEELNYYIDTISSLKESLNNSDKSTELINNINNYNFNSMIKNHNTKMKKDNIIYKNMNSKDKYIKSLQQKINQQEEQIEKLIDYKNLCEEKIKEMNPLISFPLKSDLTYAKDYMNNKFLFKNKNKGNNQKLNLSFNQNHININKKKRSIPFKINRANSEININNSSISDADKYDKLYSKYIQIINDFKNLSNNSVSTNEYTRLKTQFNELKNKNNNLLKQIQNEKNKSININNDNTLQIKSLQEQVSTFREELILSQAMVNSLRAELEQYNNSNPKKSDAFNKDNILNYNDIMDNDNNIILNNNNKDLSLKEENENLKMSLKNNNILLSKVLEENNKLREKNFICQNPNTYYIQENENILKLKDNLKQYENKIDYFNDYINNIKAQISNIFNELKSIIYQLDTTERRNNLSENFFQKLKDLKTEIEKVKNIDRFNLDSTDDEKCLKLVLSTIKLLLTETDKNKINANNFKENNTFDKTKKYLKEILEIIKEIINENGTKQLISDAMNILNNLDNLYKIKNNNLNGYNINEKIYEQEKELNYIKKLLLNQKKNNNNKNLTYIMNYRSPKVENSRHFNDYFFKYE